MRKWGNGEMRKWGGLRGSEDIGDKRKGVLR